MTRRYFLDNITCWSALIAFCCDEDCDYCEDVYASEDLDENIEEDIADMLNNGESWRHIRDYLADIDTGYDYYRKDGWLDYVPLDDDYDFDSCLSDVLAWCEDNDVFDEEDDDVLSMEEDEEIEEEPVFEEAFPIFDLFSACKSDMAAQVAENYKRQMERRAEIDRALQELIPF